MSAFLMMNGPSHGDDSLCMFLLIPAKDQLADATLLCSSVQYALSSATKEITTLKREFAAAKGNTWPSCWFGL